MVGRKRSAPVAHASEPTLSRDRGGASSVPIGPERDGRPTTGDPAVDQIIRDKMGEACDLAYAILIDRHPNFRASQSTDAEAKKTAAILVTQLWRPIAEVIMGGMRLAAKDHGG